ncbi:MAG: UvrD-helicase domain-containing protein [Acutalibacteraceae bacterium]
MNKRISAETGHNIAALTFHKLGLNIISQVNGRMPRITQINLRKFVKEQLMLNMQSDAYLNLLSSYLLYNRVVAKSEFDFKSQKEYDEYLKLNPPTTVNNEIVKSYGEMDIANFLMQNGIRYIYEQPYEMDTSTSEHSQYHPDFYLPDYKIYIEYFGINRNGEVPSYFKATNEMTATESYRASMEWKRSIHHWNQTTMIECYAYEKLEGTLLDALKEKLEAASVVLTPKSSQELWTQVSAESDSLLDGIIELFETLINLIKSNEYDIATVRKLNYTGGNTQTNHILLSLLEPIFNAYCKHLSDHKEIDFNDMINLASEYVKQGKYINPYSNVIVDEYQDISKARYRFLDCLRKSRDYALFCVGDDWQSIYRFAGSDIGFILNFSKYWGATEISKIETTYRFSQKLIEISSGFIMQNPVQIKKSIKGKTDELGFPLGEISGYTEKYAIEFMSKKLNDIPKGSSVFFIGRYSFDAKLLNDSGLFACQYNNANMVVDVKSKTRPDLSMSFLTAHKAKGLQADYVFIINNKKSRMGFPSKIQDAPILDLLLDNCDQYPYAEERRLFYVALTRAKKKAFIVTINGQESEFAIELKKRYGNELKKEQFECPLCGGRLVKRSGPYGEFFGCSNYRTTGCNYKRKIR